MILVTQRYTPSSESRLREISKCKSANEDSGLFSRVEVVDGDSRRWTFGELVELCRERFLGETCVIANSDIVIDETCREAGLVLSRFGLLALTRWESLACPRMLGHVMNDRFFSGTQDSWWFVSGTLPRVDIEIPLGHVGCDQIIVGWAAKRGVSVANPALALRTYHVHEDESRPDRPCLAGYYGYPELTTSEATGEVLCHRWDGESVFHLCAK